ncbi:hypothetical protein ACP3PM_20995 [Pseudomonas iridis]
MPRVAAEGGLFGAEDFGSNRAPFLFCGNRFAAKPLLGFFRQILAGLAPSATEAKRQNAHLIAERFAPPDLGLCANKHACTSPAVHRQAVE